MEIQYKLDPCKWFPLKSVGELYQGISLQRHLCQPNTPSSQHLLIVQPRDLDNLLVEEEGLQSEYLLPTSSPSFSLREGDILITVKGTSQKAAVIGSSAVGAVAAQNMAMLRLSSGFKYPVSPLYLAGLLRSEAFQQKLSRLYRQSTGTRSISLKQLRELTIPIPNLEHQQLLVDAFLALKMFRLASLWAVEARQNTLERSLEELLQQEE